MSSSPRSPLAERDDPLLWRCHAGHVLLGSTAGRDDPERAAGQALTVLLCRVCVHLTLTVGCTKALVHVRQSDAHRLG